MQKMRSFSSGLVLFPQTYILVFGHVVFVAQQACLLVSEHQHVINIYIYNVG